MWAGLPNVANKNTEHVVEHEFQIMDNQHKRLKYRMGHSYVKNYLLI